MKFLSWHYSEGLNMYLRRWYFLMAWIVHYFSLPLLLPTLFAPWKRLEDTEAGTGFSFERSFQQFTFNLVSRCIGAVVRLTLFIFGTLVLFPAFLIGLIGLIFWIVIPAIGFPYYLTSDIDHRRLYSDILTDLKKSPDTLNMVFDNPPGRFVLTHINADIEFLRKHARKDHVDFSGFTPKGFTSFINHLLQAGVWDEPDLKKTGLAFADLVTAANWWDSVYSVSLDVEDETFHLSRPGIGLDLLFGYTPILDQYSTDLSFTNFAHHLIGREALVDRIDRELVGSTGVILSGQPGVGKKTVVLEFARRAMAGELSPELLYKRVLELDYSFLLSQATDLNQKKTKLARILQEAVSAGNIILVIKDLHRLTFLDMEGVDFTDVFEKYLESRKLKIITLLGTEEYERFLLPNRRLRKFFQTIEVPPVSKADALKILFESAAAWEKSKKITITVQAIRQLLDGADRYITDTPFPEKVLELLDHVIVYLEKQRRHLMVAEDVLVVLSEQTGISLSSITESRKSLLSNLETVLHERLIGQDNAVKQISQSLRARVVGTKDENRPVGTFLFLGPTGVGKTEAAKSLSRAYYGSEKYLLRFDMAEYVGQEGVARLIGSVSKNQPGILTSSIRKHPVGLLLLDEIEKAPKEIYNLFLTLLDEGVITDAFGKQVSCKNLFVVATSNASANYIRDLVNKNVSEDELQRLVLDSVQKDGQFSPEFINRFDGVIVFTPLTSSQLISVARLMLQEVKNKLIQQNIYLEIDDSLCEAVAKVGFDPQYGARPMRRVVDLNIGDAIAKAILSGEIESGDRIRLVSVSPREFSVKKV